MKSAPKRWSVNAILEGANRIAYYCDGRPLAGDSQAEPQILSPVQHLLVGLAGCFTLSCQAILHKKRRKGLGLEIVVTGQKATGPAHRLSAIRVSAIFRGDLTNDEAAAIVEEAKPLCTMANTVLCAPAFAYETWTLGTRSPLPHTQLIGAVRQRPARTSHFTSSA